MRVGFLLSIVFVIGIVAARTPQQYRTAFQEFQRTYNKTYTESEEYYTRFEIFQQNVDFIDNWTGDFNVAINQFADLTNDEFVRMMNGYRATPGRTRHEVPLFSKANPTSVDWRDEGVVTGVKNQGQCGSCWSFSTTGSVEGAHALKTGSLVSLSEQNLMDCSWSYGNFGCAGGEMDNAFKYIINNKGIDTEASYPYTMKDGTCHYDAKNSGATISSYHDVPRGSEADLETASATIGPVSVAIDASHMSFQFYHSGVYYEPKCSSTQLDHGVLVVGYGVDSGSDYWIVKNSWGVTWGQAGYIWMAKDRDNNCGIATEASYPIV